MEFVVAALKPAIMLLILAAAFALLLAYLGIKLSVHQDEKIDEVNKKLSGANCGACGYAGCVAFAKALVEGKANLSDCSSTSAENKHDISVILGISDNCVETKLVVSCNGGNACKDKYSYQGYGDCKSMDLLSGGRKACDSGCMGMGSCTNACHYHAITVGSEGYAVFNYQLCINCGLCVKSCPKLLIKPIPKVAKIYIACLNTDKGAEVRKICKSGCIACGLCAKVCPEGAITVVDNLARIDYNKCTGCLSCVNKCPTKVIKVI